MEEIVRAGLRELHDFYREVCREQLVGLSREDVELLGRALKGD
jgi:hypothetical protein